MSFAPSGGKFLTIRRKLRQAHFFYPGGKGWSAGVTRVSQSTAMSTRGRGRTEGQWKGGMGWNRPRPTFAASMGVSLFVTAPVLTCLFSCKMGITAFTSQLFWEPRLGSAGRKRSRNNPTASAELSHSASREWAPCPREAHRGSGPAAPPHPLPARSPRKLRA